MRTYNLNLLLKTMGPHLPIEGFDPVVWLAENDNIALTNSNEDLALFENQTNLGGVVCGHYFFNSRGKQAIQAAQEFLKEIFSGEYPVEIITGLTPIDHKGALWMNRRLGFKSHGQVSTVIGPCEFVILTKQQWEEAHNE